MEFNIADLFEAVADVAQDRIALVSGDRKLTFSQLDERANRFANHLKKSGVGPGEHVGLYLYNHGEFVEALLGIFKIRAVPINLNYRYVAEELRYVLDDGDVVALLHQQELTSVVDEIRGEFGGMKAFISVADDSGLDSNGSVDYETALAASTPVADFGQRSGDDVYIIYTGGTTGMPRGVMWRHEDVFFAGLQGGRPGDDPIETPEEIREVVADVNNARNILPGAPFIHGAAQWASLIAMFTGGKTIIAPGKRYDPDLVWALAEREEANVINMVGDAMIEPLITAFEAKEGGYDTEALAVISSAGAILSERLQEKLQQILPDVTVLNSFGASEAGHMGTFISGVVGPTGRPVFIQNPNTAVVDEDGKHLEPGCGVIGKLARYGRVPLGYYKAPEKTAENFREIDGVRYVLPGDMAMVEEDGTITVLGRGNVCINSGGEKIFPEEVEEVVKAHPHVVDAVIVGAPDERWGQRVAAIVQTTPGAELTLEALDEHCRAKLAGYKVPRQLHLVDEVVRQPSGKPHYRWAKGIVGASQ